MPVIIRGRRVMFLPSRPGDGPQPLKRPPCSYCGKPGHAFAPTWGSHLGSSGVLRDNILGKREADAHRWYTGRWSISAHHLICSEAMADDDDWATYCHEFGYDINRRENGVILPSRMGVACELHVPVHRGNHVEGWAYDVQLAYPKAVMAELRRIRAQVAHGAYCSNPAALIQRLDELSARILVKVARFRWTLSSDGLDYQDDGVGCAGVTSITDKPRRPCPHARKHGSKHGVTGEALTRHPLSVGG